MNIQVFHSIRAIGIFPYFFFRGISTSVMDFDVKLNVRRKDVCFRNFTRGTACHVRKSYTNFFPIARIFSNQRCPEDIRIQHSHNHLSHFTTIGKVIKVIIFFFFILFDCESEKLTFKLLSKMRRLCTFKSSIGIVKLLRRVSIFNFGLAGDRTRNDIRLLACFRSI